MNHTSEYMLKLSRAEKNARKRMRFLAIAQFLECKNYTHVANQLKISRTSVNKWVTQYLGSGWPGSTQSERAYTILSANQQGDYVEK